MKMIVQPRFLRPIHGLFNILIVTLLIVLSLIIGVGPSPVQADLDMPDRQTRKQLFSEPLMKATLSDVIIYVKADATGANDGTSWQDAYTDLQEALAVATAGDEIWVAAGTYKPTESTDRRVSFQLKSGVALYGGFNGTETTREQRDWESHLTMMSGDLNGNDNGNVDPDNPTRADNSYHVLTSNRTDRSAILDGFIITAGNANGIVVSNNEDRQNLNILDNSRLNHMITRSNSSISSGGGMYNTNDSSPTVRNVTFTENSASGNGGAIYNLNSNPIISHVNFIRNYANFGGGVFNSKNNLIIIKSTFLENSANFGGGMFNLSSNSTVSHVTFKGNLATFGGGMFINSSTPTISHVILSGNFAHNEGGGIFNNNSNPTIINSTFSGNLANNEGGGIFNDNDSHPTLSNSILWDNKDNSGTGGSAQIYGGTANVSYSLIQGGFDGTANINADPQFVSSINPLDAPTSAGDFHLQPTSPAIDAGDNSTVPPDTLDLDQDDDMTELLPFDLDSKPRFRDHPVADTGNGMSPVVDIGAYENGLIIYVKANATGANNGTSWANAYTGLQNALMAADNGAEIWVAAGTYKPSSSTASFSMKSGVALYGGFNGSEQRDWDANPTILSGDLNGNDNNNVDPNEPTRADNSHHVVISNGVDSTAVLDGFIISGGNANDNGGGMYNFNNSSVTVSNVTFNNNSASGNGGGMVNFNSSPTISNVTFSNNSTASSGGGMANGNSSPTVRNVNFSGNSASGDGGGMFNYNNSNPIVSETAFRGNSANSAGGGMVNLNSSPEISNALFSGNLATLGGGAMLNVNSNPMISNVTFSGNRASYAAGISNDNRSSPTLINSILWNNQDEGGTGASAQILGGTPRVTYSLVQGGWSGTGNVNSNPQFNNPINPNNAPSTGGDFHLSSNSPAIDVGNNSAVSPSAADLDSNQRISGGTVDMGAYESGSGSETGSLESEPNDSCQQAGPISDSQVYTGALDAEGDEDFFAIEVTSPFDNLIITLTEPVNDYEVELFYADCTEDGARNIGYGHNIGEERLVYNVGTETGTYYIRVLTDEPTSSSPYTLQVDIEPNDPNTVRTLILVNRSRLQTLYGMERTSALLDKLNTLANHPTVAGRIVQVDQDSAVTATYNLWEQSPSSTDRANDATIAIKSYLTSQHGALPAMQEDGYLVIVGDDRVIPFHRVHVYNYWRPGDPSWVTESEYANSHLNSNQPSTVASALFDDQTLTDDFYADFTPTPWRVDHDLYIPDLAIGRLVEEPEEMIAVIDAFLAANGQVNLNRGAVSGYDFIQDTAQNQYNTLSADGLTIDNSLVGGQFSGNHLIQKMLQPSNDVCAINGHATHYQQGAPDSTAMLSTDVLNASGDFSGNLFFTVGCQSGLNVPPGESNALDFPQAFASRGMTYVGNTGWAYGMSRSLGLTEKLMALFTENIVEGNSASVGLALTKAKHDYWLLNDQNQQDYYDEKIMIEATLFGLPMLQLNSPSQSSRSSLQKTSHEGVKQTLRVSPERAASPNPALAEESGWRVDASLPSSLSVIRMQYQFPEIVSRSTEDGRYYTANGLALSNPFEPIQPLFWHNVENSLGDAKGVLMIAGLYGEENGFDPVIENAIDLNLHQERRSVPEPEFNSENFYPALPYQFNTISTLGNQRKERLVIFLGQYDSKTQTERLFDNMTVDIYYSDSDDETAPTIGTLTQAKQGNQVQVSVPVTDNNGVQRVIATYTTGVHDDGNGNINGEWLSVDLTLNGNNTWSGTIPGGDNTSFFIQAADTAGNVAVDDNNGRYFTAGIAPMESIYLPLVIR